MKDFITVTRKGQATIPTEIRQKLGVPLQGGKLRVRFNNLTQEMVLSKSIDIEELANKISGYVKPGVRPVTDASAYYQRHRKATKYGAR